MDISKFEAFNSASSDIEILGELFFKVFNVTLFNTAFEFLNVEYVKDEVIFTDYKNRLKALSKVQNCNGFYHLFERFCSIYFLNHPSFYEDVEKRNPGEKEFLQAVKEVFVSLEPVVEQNPNIEKWGIMERIAEILSP